MLPFLNALRGVDFPGVFMRMVFALLCGMSIGLERSYKNRAAGFRTHVLVCTGATVASVTGIYLFLYLQLPTDMSRIGAQVIAGLGFIGAGTIFLSRNGTLKGLTTAAGLWTTGIIGLAVGAGFYEGAVIATILVLLVQVYFSRIGTSIDHPPEFDLKLIYTEKASLDDVLRYCKSRKLAIKNLRITKTPAEAVGYTAVLRLNPNQKRIQYDALVHWIRSIPGVVYAEILDTEDE